MHKKLFIIISLIFSFTFLGVSSLTAEITPHYEDDDTGLFTFDAKLFGFWISYDGGSSWYEIFNYTDDSDNAPTVDVAAGEVGSQMGSFTSRVSIPEGTITHVKFRPSTTTVIKGWKKENDTYYVTDSNIPIALTSEFGRTEPEESDCDEITLSPPPDSDEGDYFDVTQEVSRGGIVVTAEEEINVSVLFDLSVMIELETFDIEGRNRKVIIPGDAEGSTPTVTQI